MGEVVRWLVVAAAAAVLAVSWRRAGSLQVGPVEERIFRRVNGLSDALHPPVWAVMQAGSLAAVFVVPAALMGQDENQRAVVAFGVGFLMWLGVKEGKHLVGRGRPAAHLADVRVRGEDQTGLGYPSGHAAVSLSLALVATGAAGVPIAMAAIGVAAITGAARMYVGAHLPLDVVGGFAIGLITAEVANAGIVAWG